MRQSVPFGKYLLLERISVGGMAEVFKAKTFGVEGFEKLLAIKRILPSMAEDADFIQMFIDEAKICGQLNHANICQTYELGRIEDSHFIAMEYIWGKDLLQIQNRFRRLKRSMPPMMAAFVISKVCEGLDYAHKKKDATGKPLGIIHRDVSPQNILISYDGEVKVIDFGIAKAASRSSKTQAGVLKGKFGYMSPEHVRGEELDRRADIFSIGTIFYEILTNERLFLGESDFATLEKIRSGDVPPPSKLNPEVPPVIDEIILKALSRETQTRYQWASEMQEALQNFLMMDDVIFNAKSMAAWMREQFAVEMRREAQILEEQRKIGPESMQAQSSAPRPAPPANRLRAGVNSGAGLKAPKEPPRVPVQAGEIAALPEGGIDVGLDGDGEDVGGEKTMVAGQMGEGGDAFSAQATQIAEQPAAPGTEELPNLATQIVDGASDLPNQSTQIVGGIAEGGSTEQGSDLAPSPTVVLDPSRSSMRPPIDLAPPPAYPPQQGYPPPGFPPQVQQPAYPQPGYPQPGYPQPGYPHAQPQPGFPPQQMGYPPPGMTGSAMLPVGMPGMPLSGQPPGPLMSGAHPGYGDPSMVLRANMTASAFVPVAPQPQPPSAPYSRSHLIWKDILVGVGVAAVVVLLVLGIRVVLSPAKGTIILTVLPPRLSEVYLDGKMVGKVQPGGSLLLRNVTLSQHQIRVRADDGEGQQVLNVTSSEPVQATINLGGGKQGEAAANNGLIRLKLPPEGGYLVTVDDRLLSEKEVGGGFWVSANTPHKVVVSRAGKRDKTLQITVAPGAEETRQVELLDARGKLTIDTDPSGAEISVNGQFRGKSPLVVDDLIPVAGKPIRITAKKRGAGSANKSVMLTEQNGFQETLLLKLQRSESRTDEEGGETATPTSPPSSPPVASQGSGANGYLVANTKPWARVYIDGKDTGRMTPIAPRDRIPLNPGKHQITFVTLNQKKFSFEVVIRSNEEQKIIKDLEQN